MPDVAVIVGAGPGMGLAIARTFGSAGLDLALVTLDEATAQQLVTALGEDGVAAEGFLADTADERSLRSALQAIRDRYGAPAVVVYNPSAWVEGPPTALSYQAFVEGLRVGVAGFVVVLNEIATAMAAAGRGTILTTGSAAALRPTPAAAGLAAQKTALRALTAAAAQELAPAGVHVATVIIDGTLAPGTKFDPERIAPTYLELHQESDPASWRTELIYR